MSNHYYNESSIKLNVVKQKIIQSLLVYNYELIAMCFCRLYTASSTSKTWLYTELEGSLTLVIDYARKSARFLLFDLNTFEIIFECELHKNFHLFYTSQSDTLHSFEVSKGFIGFSIPDKASAQMFLNSVTRLTDANISKKIKEKIIPNKSELKSNSYKVLALVKEKLAGEYFFKENAPSEKKLELDLTNIERLINMIEYDVENEKFLITGSASEIDELVAKVKSVKYSDKNGLRITDTVAYAMEIYQNMMNSMVKNNEVKSNKKEEAPIKKRTLVEFLKQEVYGSSGAKNTKIDQTQSNNSVATPSQKGVPPVPQGVPAVPKGVPPVPKGIPPVPKGVPPVPKGVPPVPKGMPAVPKVVPGIPKILPAVPQGVPSISLAQKSNQGNVENVCNISRNEVTNGDQSATIGNNKYLSVPSDSPSNTNITTEAPEQNKNIRKKEPPKMDIMTELRMKLANRGSALVPPVQNGAEVSGVKPPIIINTNCNITLNKEETNNIPSNNQTETHSTKIQENESKLTDGHININVEKTVSIDSTTTSKIN